MPKLTRKNLGKNRVKTMKKQIIAVPSNKKGVETIKWLFGSDDSDDSDE